MADDDFELVSSLRYDPALLQVPSSGPGHAGWNAARASPLYMLDYHRDRMLRAAAHWGWDSAVDVLSGDAGLDRLASAIMSRVSGGGHERSPLKVRIRITREGQLAVRTGSVPETPLGNLFPSHLPPPEGQQASQPNPNSNSIISIPQKITEYRVLVDSEGITRSEHTHFKTTERAAYESARQRARIDGGLPLLNSNGATTPTPPTPPTEVLVVNRADGAVMEGSIATVYLWRAGRWATPAVSRGGYDPERGSGGQDGTTRRWALER